MSYSPGRFRLVSLGVTVAVALVVALCPADVSAGSPAASPTADALAAMLSRGPEPAARAVPKEHQCVLQAIACGETVVSNLTTHDCALDDGTFLDFFIFTGQAGQSVTIDLSSGSFDPYLFLLDPTPEVVAEDDDSGPGTAARIVFPLDQTSDEWVIAVNSLFPETGQYTLSLQCSGSGDGFFSDPSYPGFRFRVTIGDPGSTIAGQRESSCQPETVCVSGALPGRSELFLRIIGPRPNGYLWPTLVRFTPSRVVVEIRQVSTGITRRYVMDAVPPGTDELPGLQDRTGFLP